MYFATWSELGYDLFSKIFLGVSFDTLTDPNFYYASLVDSSNLVQLVVWCTHLAEFGILLFTIYSAYSLFTKTFRRLL